MGKDGEQQQQQQQGGKESEARGAAGVRVQEGAVLAVMHAALRTEDAQEGLKAAQQVRKGTGMEARWRARRQLSR